jgi:hypothetical protein
MTDNNTNDLVEYLRNGEWIAKMTPSENILLADFLKNSMAKQRKKVAFAEKVKDGVLYVVYKVREHKAENTLDLVPPGEIYVHPEGEELPKEIANLPRVAFATIFCLGELDG